MALQSPSPDVLDVAHPEWALGIRQGVADRSPRVMRMIRMSEGAGNAGAGRGPARPVGTS